MLRHWNDDGTSSKIALLLVKAKKQQGATTKQARLDDDVDTATHIYIWQGRRAARETHGHVVTMQLSICAVVQHVLCRMTRCCTSRYPASSFSCLVLPQA